MHKPQERQDLLSTCLHPFLGAGIAVHLCCSAVAGMQCSELSSSLCLVIEEETVAFKNSLLLFSLGQKPGAPCCLLIHTSQKKGFLKPVGGVTCCHWFQIKCPWVASEMDVSDFS